MADKKEKDSKARKTARYAGAALTAAGVLGAIKGRPMLSMAARRARGIKDSGKDLSDYIAAGQSGLNEGLTGKALGKYYERGSRKVRKDAFGRPATKAGRRYEQKKIAKAIRTAKAQGKSTKGVANKVRGDIGMEGFSTDHYRRFRSGHREGLKHYDWEARAHNRHRRSQKGQDGRLLSQKGGKAKVAKVAPMTEQALSKGSKKVLGRRGLVQKNLNAGMNEKEAVRKALTSKDPDVVKYTKAMVLHKSGKGADNAYKKYMKAAIIAGPGAIAAGGALTGASYLKAKNKKNKKKK